MDDSAKTAGVITMPSLARLPLDVTLLRCAMPLRRWYSHFQGAGRSAVVAADGGADSAKPSDHQQPHRRLGYSGQHAFNFATRNRVPGADIILRFGHRELGSVRCNVDRIQGRKVGGVRLRVSKRTIGTAGGSSGIISVVHTRSKIGVTPSDIGVSQADRVAKLLADSHIPPSGGVVLRSVEIIIVEPNRCLDDETARQPDIGISQPSVSTVVSVTDLYGSEYGVTGCGGRAGDDLEIDLGRSRPATGRRRQIGRPCAGEIVADPYRQQSRPRPAIAIP